MSEEEEKAIEWCKAQKSRYIQILLDLYTKEKANYELLFNGYNERVKQIQKLEKELEQEKEKNKKLRKQRKELNTLLGEFIDNSIDKQVVKDKIKELKEEISILEKTPVNKEKFNETLKNIDIIIEKETKIEVLEDLLKEN